MLADKIWITRKTRIYAEKRLQEHAFISEFSMILFSLALVSLSVWNLENNDPKINLLQIFTSTAALVLSVFLTSQKFSERSVILRNCYIKLDEVYSKTRRAEEAKDLAMLQQLESEYTGLLINVENHTDYDFLCLRFSLRNDPNSTLLKLTTFDICSYWFQTGLRFVVKTILLVVPLVLMVVVWF